MREIDQLDWKIKSLISEKKTKPFFFFPDQRETIKKTFFFFASFFRPDTEASPAKPKKKLIPR
jgi:hypothetical protein